MKTIRFLKSDFKDPRLFNTLVTEICKQRDFDHRDLEVQALEFQLSPRTGIHLDCRILVNGKGELKRQKTRAQNGQVKRIHKDLSQIEVSPSV